MKKRKLIFFISLAGGFAVSLWYSLARGCFIRSEYMTLNVRFGIMSDGTLSGCIAVFGAALLMWLLRSKLFDRIRYTRAATWLNPAEKRSMVRTESFREFREKLEIKRDGQIKPVVFSGVIWMVVSLVFFGLYYIFQ